MFRYLRTMASTSARMFQALPYLALPLAQHQHQHKSSQFSNIINSSFCLAFWMQVWLIIARHRDGFYCCTLGVWFFADRSNAVLEAIQLTMPLLPSVHQAQNNFIKVSFPSLYLFCIELDYCCAGLSWNIGSSRANFPDPLSQLGRHTPPPPVFTSTTALIFTTPIKAKKEHIRSSCKWCLVQPLLQAWKVRIKTPLLRISDGL